MNPDSPQAQEYLLQLYRITNGDLNAKTSMFEVGAAVGLDKTDSGKMAEELIARGWVEIKTLSGGIGITSEGIEIAQEKDAGVAGRGHEPELTLGEGPLLENQDRQALDTYLIEIKKRLPSLGLDDSRLEEVFIDIKTLEVQLLSSRPKTEIIRPILRSIQEALVGADIKRFKV